MIFVDTSYWIALRNRRDRWHGEAAALLEKHEKRMLITSNHVCGETWTYLRRRAGHGAAVEFLDSIESSTRIRIRIVPIEDKHESAAIRWLRRHDEREYSFVDATSFNLMRTLRLMEVFAFDGDFQAAGFIELRT